MFGNSIKVTGRVQGVGFRAFVASAARRRGIVGEVWNTRDGSVELVAFHEDVAELDGLVEDLRLGPGMVRNVTSHEISCSDVPSEFRVGFSR